MTPAAGWYLVGRHDNECGDRFIHGRAIEEGFFEWFQATGWSGDSGRLGDGYWWNRIEIPDTVPENWEGWPSFRPGG